MPRAQQIEEFGQLVGRLEAQRRQDLLVPAQALSADLVEEVLPRAAEALQQLQIGRQPRGIRQDIARRHCALPIKELNRRDAPQGSKKIGRGQVHWLGLDRTTPGPAITDKP